MVKKTSLLIFFIIFSFIDVWMLYIGDKDLLFLPRVLSLFALLCYGYLSIKMVTKKMYLLGFFILSTGVLFSLDDYTILGMVSLVALRISWLSVLVSYKEKSDPKVVLMVFILAIVLISIVLYSMYVDTLFFYLSVLTTLSLLLLLAFSFSNALTLSPKFGNKEMFIAVVIFFLSDALSGAKKIEGTSTFFLILSVVLYNVAYFFLINAFIKKDEKVFPSVS